MHPDRPNYYAMYMDVHSVYPQIPVLTVPFNKITHDFILTGNPTAPGRPGTPELPSNPGKP